MSSKRWLVVGAGGQLGSRFVEVLTAKGEHYLALTRSQLDVTGSQAVSRALDDFQPTHIVNCSAWIDVEAAEDKRAEAFALNADALGNFFPYAERADALFINFSTDYVFDGEKRSPYLPTDEVNPINVYGASKVAGEELLHSAIPQNALTIRTSWLMGSTPANFVYRMGLRALQELSTEVVNDQIGIPTSSGELASTLIAAIKQRRITGIRHIANTGIASRYEWAQEIYRLLGKDLTLVIPGTSEAIQTKAKRPKYSVLDTSENPALGIPPLSDWREALAQSYAINDLLGRN